MAAGAAQLATSLPSRRVEMPGSVTVKNVCASLEKHGTQGGQGNSSPSSLLPVKLYRNRPKWNSLKLHRVAARTVERAQLESAGPTSSQFVLFQEASVGCGSSAAPASNQGNPFNTAFDRNVGNWAVPWGSGGGAFRWRRCQSSPLRVTAPEALRPNCGEALVFRFFPSATVAMDFPSNGGQEPGKACWGDANLCGAPTRKPFTAQSARPGTFHSDRSSVTVVALTQTSFSVPTKALEQVLDGGVATEQTETILSESSASCLDETGWAGSLGLRCGTRIWLVE
ncbi:hypothetical protein Landi51_11752 [Colletotrichum acutatum]